MSGLVRNYIGDHAESICATTLGSFFGRDFPFFIPNFLGQKFEAIDYYVQLVGLRGEFMPYYFLVQVKSTRQGYTKMKGHLKVKVSDTDIRKLTSYSAPTYIVGVDEPSAQCYLASANEGCPNKIPSLPTQFPLDGKNSELLWQEVKNFWESNKIRLSSSQFSITL